MNKILLGSAVALLAASTAYAQDYQAELGAAYLNGDVNGMDFDGVGLHAEVHLEKVDTGKGPLNEASFLDKSSFAELTWITLDPDAANASSEDTISFDGRFVTQSNFIVEAGFTDLEDDEAFSVGLGMYINDTLDGVLRYQTFDEADASSLSAALHSVNKLQGDSALAYDFGLAWLDENNDNGYQISAGADYYLDRKLSIGASLALASVDDVDVSTVQFGVNYFVTPVVRIGADYISLGQDGDGDTLALNANLRL